MSRDAKIFVMGILTGVLGLLLSIVLSAEMPELIKLIEESWRIK